METKKKKIKRQYNTLERVLIFIFTFIFCVSAGMLVFFALEYNKGSSAYNDLENKYVQVIKPISGEGSGADANTATFLQVDFDALAKINPDIVAWIYIPGTQINYPVVHGPDNDYYLKHLFNGTSNKAGSIFVDAYNAHKFEDINTIIYGHNMANKSMFSVLMEYKTQEYYDAHSVIYIMTPNGNYTIEIFSAYVANVEMDSWTRQFSGEQSIEMWLKNAKQRSTIKSDVDVSVSDKFITLSTCTYEFDDARYIVVGKLVKADN